jgi:5-methylcytosine-specific restriction enzyme subunit McrC
MPRKYYCITEYGYLASKEYTRSVDKGCALLEASVFDELEKFVLENSREDDGPSRFLNIAYKRGTGKILRAQNYVGLIETKSGVNIEILPKIYDADETSYDRTRLLLLKMLKCLRDAPFKRSSLSSVKTSKMPLLDIFISMFLEELSTLIKRGIKSGYIQYEDNSKFYKGKLLVNKQINHNLVHKERFYVQFDEYSKNKPENRIIKSTLKYLNDKTNDSRLQRAIREHIFVFDEADFSTDIKADFNKCENSRSMSDYDVILKWCKIFLTGESFTNYRGSSIAYSLLFPMEKIFESYVAKHIRQSEYFNGWKVLTQDSRFYLIEDPKRFKLKPDIVIMKDGALVILDTKWKLLYDDADKNYGISQGDLYQMFAYAKKYDCKQIVLLYPLNNRVSSMPDQIQFCYDSDIRVNAYFIDLEDMDESLKGLKVLLER